jgi:glutamate-1-semialdehyde 2,1-aminomutase
MYPLRKKNMVKTNESLFSSAKKYIPGGVNSPVRSFNAVGGIPFFTQEAKDHYLIDVENKKYIDYVCSWGANIVGHANSYVIEQVNQALTRGFSYGTPTELEVEIAQEINKLVPSMQKVRLVSSGTEAVMSAIRLARGYTNKKIIIKFNGCYHGHSDSLLVKAGSGLVTFNNPSSRGVFEELVKHTMVLEYNSVEELHLAFSKHPNEIAAIIIEPIAGNMNFVRPSKQFLQALVELCDKNGTLLIFDEVMTGFRVGLGGAQELFKIKPDITILGKIVGGGMPLAAFGGRAEIMDRLAPVGDVYQAGTLSGNPIAVTCGLSTLKLIQEKGFYSKLTATTKQLMQGLTQVAMKHNIPFSNDYEGGMFGFFFTENLPHNFIDVKQAPIVRFNYFYHLMLQHGIFFAPSMFEVGFITCKHSIDVVNTTIEIADTVFRQLKE